MAHQTAGLNDRPTLSHVSCAGQTVCWRADTYPALVVTTAATALAQPTVTRALKTLNRGGIVVGDRHIDGERSVELTATARGAEECLPTAAGSALPGRFAGIPAALNVGVEGLLVGGYRVLDMAGPVVGQHLGSSLLDRVERLRAATSRGEILESSTVAAMSVSMNPACTPTTRVPWLRSSTRSALVNAHSADLDAQ